MSDAPTLPSGHPQRHGYVQCARCGTWRLPEHLVSDNGEKTGTDIHRCADVAWCSEQAKATGRLEAP